MYERDSGGVSSVSLVTTDHFKEIFPATTAVSAGDTAQLWVGCFRLLADNQVFQDIHADLHRCPFHHNRAQLLHCGAGLMPRQ